MFSTIKKLQLLVPLKEIAELFKIAVDLGLPPDPCEEGEFKLWIAKLLDVVLKVVTVTPTEIDDMIVTILQTAMKSDEGWTIFYRVVMLFDTHDDSPEFGANVEAGDAPVATLAKEVSMDPATILLLVKTIMEFIKMWRNR